MEKYRKIDLFTLELGYALCDEEHLESILKPIVEIRENIFEKHGVVIHHVRVKDNSKLLPFEYVIKVSDCEVARYTLKKDSSEASMRTTNTALRKFYCTKGLSARYSYFRKQFTFRRHIWTTSHFQTESRCHSWAMACIR